MTQQAEAFAHLLQPIRDLAGNWNIDIAHELEDYLVRPSAGGSLYTREPAPRACVRREVPGC